MKTSSQTITDQLTELAHKLFRYRVLLVCAIIAACYGFLVYKIGTLSSMEPSSDAVASQSKVAKVPHIDDGILSQLKSLQDNSSSVKALFNDGRSNPFQE